MTASYGWLAESIIAGVLARNSRLDRSVAGAYAERQVYARDRNFRYAMEPTEPPRKASRLIVDRR